MSARRSASRASKRFRAFPVTAAPAAPEVVRSSASDPAAPPRGRHPPGFEESCIAVVDYFSDWGVPELVANDAVASRAALAERFAEAGLAVPMAELSADELAARPGHVLFAFAYDQDLAMSLYAIPEDALSAALRAAMAQVSYQGYAYHELMIGDDDGLAFVRLEAAVGVDGYEEILEELEEEVPGVGATIPASDRACLAPYRIGVLEHRKEPRIEPGGLDRRFVAAFTVRRGQ